ncbi:globin family protein [Xanthobacter sp. YC-JY1]|uniref:globin family protein n=1 Tax=Xanthobacter sp. YC-JY1 TaxID=2419844 RepID=UPI001EFFDFE0|nr:globin family protein [Xanthobacter sp. YC-JY1]UJX48098.1 hemin receptor [Xanthobacter sp. YC-JY1]
MTPSQIELIQDSFRKVVPIADTAAALFYGRLFEIVPEVKPLFKGDMSLQGAKLMATLGLVVAGLNDLSKIVPAAESLARKHVAYGVKDEHYAPVGAALIWTLERGLGPDFTPETKDAWVEAYGILSSVMIAASAEAPVPAE